MRTPGEGSITLRPDGRWQVSLQVNGKRKTLYAKTERVARAKLLDLQKQLAINGTLPDPGRRTVNDLLDFWLENVGHTLKPRTVADYAAKSTLYIKPHIGKVRLSKLEPAHIQGLYGHLSSQNLKVASAHAHQILHRALRLAVLWGWLPHNPADRVLPPFYKPQRKDMWTIEQLAAFLDGTREHWLHPLFVVLAVTGCRLSEALGLKWTDVEGNTVAIKRTLHYVRGEFIEQTPKTRAGERTIVLPEGAAVALRKQRLQQTEWRLAAGEKWRNTGYVFTNQEGRPLYQWHVQHTMQRCCQRLGLPPLSPHGLRHLHASLLLSRGLPLTDVSARLGHANPNITASVYAHVIPGRDAEAARVMEGVLRGGGAL